VVICGRISQTVGGELYGVRNLGLLIGKRARIQGFAVSDFAHRYPEARTWLAAQAKSGRLRQHVHIIDGLERAPVGLGMLFRGENNENWWCVRPSNCSDTTSRTYLTLVDDIFDTQPQE
jgi:NADPH-dependent curcumin reductase CurA